MIHLSPHDPSIAPWSIYRTMIHVSYNDPCIVQWSMYRTMIHTSHNGPSIVQWSIYRTMVHLSYNDPSIVQWSMYYRNDLYESMYLCRMSEFPYWYYGIVVFHCGNWDGVFVSFCSSSDGTKDLQTAECYNFESGTWESIAALSSPRSSAGMKSVKCDWQSSCMERCLTPASTYWYRYAPCL